MPHPLSPDLTKFTQEELNNKYGDLLNRLSTAHRFGRPDMVHQLQILIEDYRAELDRRSQIQLAEMMKNSKNFSKIIDIK